MGTGTPKSCRAVIDTEQGPVDCRLELPPEATLADAIGALRVRFPQLPIDWDQAAVGIFGQQCERHFVPLEGDRIEIYRALPVDPRQARRNRVAGAPRRRGR